MAITSITEELPIDIQRCMPVNPVCLKWVNTLGGWDYWVFSCNQLEGLTTTAGDTFARFIEDLANVDTDMDYLSRGSTPELTLHAANLTADKFVGIKIVLSSIKIMMLTNPDSWRVDGEKWVTVRIAPGRYDMGDTKAALRKIEFTIQLPQLNIQSQ